MKSLSLFARAMTVLGAAVTACALNAAPAGAQATIKRPAPELVGGPWLNTSGGKPVTLAAQRGKVTIVHFWTFG